MWEDRLGTFSFMARKNENVVRAEGGRRMRRRDLQLLRFPSQVPLSLLRVVDLCLFASGPDGAYRRPEGSASRLGFLALLLLHLSVSPSICAASWAAVWRRGLLHCRGASSPVVSLFLWDFGEEGERVVDRVAPPVRRQFAALVLGSIRLGMTILGSRWFVELEVSPSWFGVCWWILLPRQWVVCWSTQVVGARAQWPTRVSCYVLSKLEAYRLGLCPCSFFVIALASDGSNITNFSLSVPDSFGRVVVLVSLTATSSVRPSLTSQHLTGLFELMSWLVLRSFRRVVLRWAIIFKSGFIAEAKITGFRLSVELGSSFCGKLLVRIGRASRLRC
ncbi:hypothetical protein F2Q68_00006101 [Brassica cretica]|uniref:Uncharacterized protein n=1 Tax=Brassica cretica TaxID=69181 RepID=A0A8S9JIS4_BRACR|nr:hypothetical protein F2Q68_00006101 [Brassica cretica]